MALCGVGVAAGWINVMAAGGSMLTVPVMLLFGLPGPVANGTNRVAILAQNAVAVLAFRKRGYEQPLLGLSLGLATLPGALVGAFAGVQLRGERFELVLAGVMLVSMAAMWQQGRAKKHAAAAPTPPASRPPSRPRLILGHLCMVGVGFWGGLIQVGVGFVLMPVLHRVLGFDLVRVNQYKVLTVLTYTIPVLAVYAGQSSVLWITGAALALGNAIGGWLGAHHTMTRGAGLVHLVFNLALIALVVRLVFF
ncbi:MAG: sulfite exporter TauE/SafE family protein [Pseudomonadota bacterium]